MKTNLKNRNTLRRILDVYPDAIVRNVANEWNIDYKLDRNILLEKIINASENNLPNIVNETRGAEYISLKYIAEHKILSLRKANHAIRKIFSNYSDDYDEEDYAEDNFESLFNAFLTVFVIMGMIAVGVKEFNGKNYNVVFMPRDTKRILKKYTDWNIIY